MGCLMFVLFKKWSSLRPKTKRELIDRFLSMFWVFVALGKTKWVCNGSVVYILWKYNRKASDVVLASLSTFLHRTPICCCFWPPAYLTYFHFLVQALHTSKTPRISSKLLSSLFFNVTMHPSHVLSRLSTLINCQATYSQEAYEVKKNPKNLAFSTTARRNNTICKAVVTT